MARVKHKKHLGNPMRAVKRPATINLGSHIWRSLEDSRHLMYCTDLADDYVAQGEYKLEDYVNKMLRAVAKAKAAA